MPQTDERDNAMEKLRSKTSCGKGADSWMKAVFETLDEAMLFISTDKKVMAFNPAAEKLLGYSADELVGGRWRSCTWTGDAAGISPPN